jgi:hypothetical protein
LLPDAAELAGEAAGALDAAVEAAALVVAAAADGDAAGASELPPAAAEDLPPELLQAASARDAVAVNTMTRVRFLEWAMSRAFLSRVRETSGGVSK